MKTVDNVLDRLQGQYVAYHESDSDTQYEMRWRGLIVAYTTAHTESRTAARKIARGEMMRGQRTAIERRITLDPVEWDRSQRENGKIVLRWDRAVAKARFARALCGYSLGEDAVCLDVHLLRLPKRRQPKTAMQQWATWFDVYRKAYGDSRADWCLDWHYRALDWIAGVQNVFIGE